MESRAIDRRFVGNFASTRILHRVGTRGAFRRVYEPRFPRDERHDRASVLDRARRSPIGRDRRRASERPGEIVHAGICIQTSPRVCVPINYAARPMSRYLSTRSLLCACVHDVCVCATPRLVPLSLSPSLARALPLLLFTRAHRTHIPGGAPTGSANLSYHHHGGQRTRSVSPLSGTDRCRPTTMSYRRLVSLTRTRARTFVSYAA